MKSKKHILADQIKKTNTKARSKFANRYDPESWKDSLLSGWDGGSWRGVNIWRLVCLAAIMITAFGGIFLRLFHLQIAQGYSNRELADSNRIKVQIIHAPRGVIYDRNGKILAQNDPGFRIFDASIPGAKKFRYISRDDALKMEIINDPSFSQLEIDSLRTYPLHSTTAHILGYVSEITEEELQNPRYSGYKAGDKVGRGGIEEVYERVLRGVDGGEIIEVDSMGNKVRTLREIPATPGQNVILSVDAELQEQMFASLKAGISNAKSCCGSAIASDPQTGEILGLVSIPSFDPSDITSGLSDTNAPFLNRAIAGTYPPGSTFKIASSLAGLASGKITESTTFDDTGVVRLGEFSFANWFFTQHGKTDGSVNMIKALQRSNDVYYYQLAQIVDENTIGQTAKELGMGKKLGIDLPGEAVGMVPDNEWKKKTIGEIWYPGDTLHLSIGQGFLLTTPLQINHLVSFIANDGKHYPPHLAKLITSHKNEPIQEFSFDPINSRKFDPGFIMSIRRGLELVPKEGGTAWPFFTFPIETAGKTGTAEFGDPENRTHAWYTSYAPARDPQIALTVMVEAGGEGSSVGGSISKEIYSWYFKKDPQYADLFKTPIATGSAQVASSSARIQGE